MTDARPLPATLTEWQRIKTGAALVEAMTRALWVLPPRVRS